MAKVIRFLSFAISLLLLFACEAPQAYDERPDPPVISPNGGTFTEYVDITFETAADRVLFTTDGSTPRVRDWHQWRTGERPGSRVRLYAEDFKGTAGETTFTVRAVAGWSAGEDEENTAEMYTASAEATATFSWAPSLPKAVAPTFSPAEGTYASPQSVTISTTELNGAVHYTTDGSAPTSAGAIATGPITVDATTTVRAITVAPGKADSAVATAAYVIVSGQTAAPTFSPGAGTYPSPPSVTIATTDTAATIRYTTDGTNPTSTTGTIVSGPIVVSATAELRAIAIAPVKSPSAVVTAAYVISLPTETVAAPVFSSGAGTYNNDVSVTMSSATASAVICYTTDGTAPACTPSGTCQVGSTIYSGAVPTNSSITLSTLSATVKAVACKAGSNPSAVTSAIYDFKAATPTSGTASGTVAWGAKPIVQSATTGATLFITKTVDGTVPADPLTLSPGACAQGSGVGAVATPASFTEVVASGLPSQSATGLKRHARYKVRACKPGYALSDVVSYDYNVVLPQPQVWSDVTGSRFAPAYGSVSSALDLYFESEVRGNTSNGASSEGVLCVGTGGTVPTCNTGSTDCATSTSIVTIPASAVRAPGGFGAPTAYAVWDGAGANDYNASERRKFSVIACRPDTLPPAASAAGEWSFALNLATYLGGAHGAPSNPQLTSVAVGVDLASESLDPATPATAASPGHVVFGLWNTGATTGTTYAALNAAGALTRSSAAMPAGISVYYTEDNLDPVLPATCGDATPGPSTWKAESSGATAHINFPFAWAQPSGGTPVRAVACAPNWTTSPVSSLTLAAAP